MLSKKILQMENAKGISIDETVRMAAELYEQVRATVHWEKRRREKFVRGAWALNLTCFFVAGLLLFAMTLVEVLVEEGKAVFLPPDIYNAAYNALAVDGVAPEEIPLLFLIGILLLLPFVFDIILAVMAKVISAEVKVKPVKVEDVLKENALGEKLLKEGVLEKKDLVLRKIDYVTDTLRKAERELYFIEYSNGSSAGRIICIVFGVMVSSLYFYVAQTDGLDLILGAIICGGICFVFCKLVLLIYKVVMKAVMQVSFSVKRVNQNWERDKKRIQRLHDEHVEKAETIYLTPKEQAELEKEREYALRKWEREKQREEQEFEAWLARTTPYCKFFNAGICNRLSTADYLFQCNHVSNPGQCSIALNNQGLGFKDV